MFNPAEFGIEQLQSFALVVLRSLGLVVLAPVFGHAQLPKSVKAGLTLFLSFILFSTLETSQVSSVLTTSVFVESGLRELMVGLLIGFMFRLLFVAVTMAGSVVGYQIGLSFSTSFDAISSEETNIIGRLWWLIAILVFLGINGHHLIISSFADSYLVIPVGSMSFTGSLVELIIKYSAYIWVLALKMAAPVMIALFLTDLTLAIMARTMPTMNVFFVGFPAKLGLGLIALAAALPVFSYVLKQSVGYLDRELQVIFLAMGKA